MPAQFGPPPAQTHVPAWKRLGLKLSPPPPPSPSALPPTPPIVGGGNKVLGGGAKAEAQVAGGVAKEDKSRKRRKKEKRKERKAKERQTIQDQKSLEENQNQGQGPELRAEEEGEAKPEDSGRDKMEEEDGGGEDEKKKRKRGGEDFGSEESGVGPLQRREQKKRKKGKEKHEGKKGGKEEEEEEEGGDPTPATPKPSRESPTTPRSLLKKTTTNGTPASKTKSVTFAVDVKLADGPFVTILSKPGKVPGDFSSSDPDELEKAYKDSSPEPDDVGGGPPALPEVETTKPQIAYLLNYYQARSSWKFSKAKQVWILRQIWNTSEFQPDLLQSALWSYINGLPVQALKDRLVAEAKTLAKQRRELLYSEELEDDAQYRRAKLVLTALGFDEIEIDDDDPEEYITP